MLKITSHLTLQLQNKVLAKGTGETEHNFWIMSSFPSSLHPLHSAPGDLEMQGAPEGL